VLGQPAFVRLGAFEDLLLKTPIPRYRDALLAAGAPISADTVGTPVPRPGVLTTSI
jgi:hypothetical protein